MAPSFLADNDRLRQLVACKKRGVELDVGEAGECDIIFVSAEHPPHPSKVLRWFEVREVGSVTRHQTDRRNDRSPARSDSHNERGEALRVVEAEGIAAEEDLTRLLLPLLTN